MAIATFAAGCFWGVEAAFRRVRGVRVTSVGYAGGHAPHPTYEQVCAGSTGHAEVVRVEYDPALVSYEQLLDLFWSEHDPTQIDRQGPDVGEQYRSAIFTHDAEQAKAAEESRAAVAARLPRPVATTIEPAGDYWPAEDYHQQFLEKRGAIPAWAAAMR